MADYHIGIDVGLSGAICVVAQFNGHWTITFYDLKPNRKDWLPSRLDLGHLKACLKDIAYMISYEDNVTIALENPTGIVRGKGNFKASTTQAESCGEVIAAISYTHWPNSDNIQFCKLHPTQWIKALDVAPGKENRIDQGKRIFRWFVNGELYQQFCEQIVREYPRKPPEESHDRVDAALIALAGRYKWTFENVEEEGRIANERLNSKELLLKRRKERAKKKRSK
jgi:hypothetical protein